MPSHTSHHVTVDGFEMVKEKLSYELIQFLLQDTHNQNAYSILNKF